MSESENDFMQWAIHCARMFGWRLHHCRPALTRSGRWATPVQGNVGFPDLVLLRPPRLVVAELKSDRGRLSTEQEAWLADFESVPCAEVYVWRPADREAVEAVLR